MSRMTSKEQGSRLYILLRTGQKSSAKTTWRHPLSTSSYCPIYHDANWMVPGNSNEFSSMSESTQTLQADPSYVKRRSCVVFPYKPLEKTWQGGMKVHPPTPPLFLSLCPRMTLKELSIFWPFSTGCSYVAHPNPTLFQEGGPGGGGCGVGGGRTLGLYVKSDKNKTIHFGALAWHIGWDPYGLGMLCYQTW